MTFFDIALALTAGVLMSGLIWVPLIGLEKYAAHVFFLGFIPAIYFAFRAHRNPRAVSDVRPTVVSAHSSRVQRTESIQPTRSNDAMGALFAVLSALVNFATAVLVPAMFVGGMTEIPLPIFTVNLMNSGYFGLAMYMGLNTLSGRYRPHGVFYRYFLDFLSSAVAALSIVGTFVAIHLGLVQGLNLSSVPGAWQFLVALACAAVFDVLFNQTPNAKEVVARLKGEEIIETRDDRVIATTTDVRRVPAGVFGGAVIHQLNQFDCKGKDVIIHPARAGETARVEVIDAPGSASAA